MCVEKDNLKGLHFYYAKGFKITEEFEEQIDGHVLKTVRKKLVLPKEENNFTTADKT